MDRLAEVPEVQAAFPDQVTEQPVRPFVLLGDQQGGAAQVGERQWTLYADPITIMEAVAHDPMWDFAAAITSHRFGVIDAFEMPGWTRPIE
jgi:hypothetical protein